MLMALLSMVQATLTLTTANTDAYGDITVTGGVLSITHNDALGNTTTTVNSGAALHLSNNITVYAGIRLNGLEYRAMVL